MKNLEKEGGEDRGSGVTVHDDSRLFGCLTADAAGLKRRFFTQGHAGVCVASPIKCCQS